MVSLTDRIVHIFASVPGVLYDIQDMAGLLMDTCNNVVWEGGKLDGYRLPTARFSPPAGGDQAASVVITGDSSNISFRACLVGPGAGTF